jgi:mRNA interferase ChpB
VERGEVWLVSLDPTLGTEQRGERRVVVVSTAAHNRLFTPLVAPITIGGDHARLHGFAVSLTGLGLNVQGVVRCDQVRVMDLRARKAKPMRERLPDDVMDDVCGRIATILVG